MSRLRSGAFYNAPPPVFSKEGVVVWASRPTGPAPRPQFGSSPPLPIGMRQGAGASPLSGSGGMPVCVGSMCGGSPLARCGSQGSSGLLSTSTPATSPLAAGLVPDSPRGFAATAFTGQEVPFPSSSVLLRPSSMHTGPYAVERKGRKNGYKPSSRFMIAVADTIGKRPSMEDEVEVWGNWRDDGASDLVAVFDGHHGREAALYACNNFRALLDERLDEKEVPKSLQATFAELQKRLLIEDVPGGTTALVALLLKDTCYIANVGDTHAVVIRSDGTHSRLSTEHRPSVPSEADLVRSRGGRVTETRPPGRPDAPAVVRVNDIISVSRALGDKDLSALLSSEPSIASFALDASARFLVVACDGVWDYMQEADVAALVASASTPHDACVAVRLEALHSGSTDNVSVVVVDLQSSSGEQQTTAKAL
eukprot:TRINITY_DN1336_c0_g1_i4.p1 TRINITY_DN1336_c0_g1~~TRINITY_DN1336_c0_g1_i4.p1  ORF type:complete len:423 (-),score=87.23 TRINITY_DN1336_c0_g1_i4:283-1551(-)